LVYFILVNNIPLDSHFDVACVDKLLSTVLIDSAMNANDVTITNF